MGFDGEVRAVAKAAFAADRPVAAVVMLTRTHHHRLAVRPSDVTRPNLASYLHYVMLSSGNVNSRQSFQSPKRLFCFSASGCCCGVLRKSLHILAR